MIGGGGKKREGNCKKEIGLTKKKCPYFKLTKKKCPYFKLLCGSLRS